MLNFEFYNPTRIVFGKDRFGRIDKFTPAHARVLITYGGGSAKKFGTIDKVREALSGRFVLEFSGIEPNPRYETLLKASKIVKEEKIDFIIAVGGGSVIDGTKFITLAAAYDGEALDILKSGNGNKFVSAAAVVPFAAVLTLPATASEMNSGGVISYGHGKFLVGSDYTFPKFSILDPTLTFTLPAAQIANGIVDSFVHTAEQYLTYPVEGRLQDRMAEGVMQTLIETGPLTLNEPENYEARANMMWCATTGLNGILGVGVPQDWATHMIGHELTALFGIDHAQSLAIVMPSLLEARKEQKKAKLLQYAQRVWNINSGDDEEKINAAISKTRDFFESLGVKTRLSDYGIGADKIPLVISNLKEHNMTKLGETRDITLEVSQQILENAV